MTALRPTEDSNIRGVASTRYPLNLICGHPNCNKPVQSAHHIFSRSQIGNGAWFVVKVGRHSTNENYLVIGGDADEITSEALPHVIGLCGSGTTGHHGDLEEHRAWIKLEDGVYVWYDQRLHPRMEKGQIVGYYPAHFRPAPDLDIYWDPIGPLNPQPGSREGKPKRKKQASTPEERKARKVTSIKTPVGEENILHELIEKGREAWAEQLGWSEDVPAYFVLITALAKALQQT